MKACYLVIVALALVLSGMFLTGALFVWPAVDAPRRVDAVFVLSGDHGERLPVALSLLKAGVAPTLVVDGTPDYPAVSQLCQGEPSPFEVVCLRPQRGDTRGEAQAAAKLSSARHWRTIAVVTSTQHVTRARVRFQHCFGGHIAMVGAARQFTNRSEAIAAVIHEWIGLLPAVANFRC